MKSDLLRQEASASSPAAPSEATGSGKQPEASTLPGKQPPRVPQRSLGGVPEAAGHGGCHGEHRPLPGTPAPVGFCAGAQPGEHGTGLLHEGKLAPGCIFRQKAWRGFFLFSFAKDQQRALQKLHRSTPSPCPVLPRGCHRGWVSLDLRGRGRQQPPCRARGKTPR